MLYCAEKPNLDQMNMLDSPHKGLIGVLYEIRESKKSETQKVPCFT